MIKTDTLRCNIFFLAKALSHITATLVNWAPSTHWTLKVLRLVLTLVLIVAGLLLAIMKTSYNFNH